MARLGRGIAATPQFIRGMFAPSATVTPDTVAAVAAVPTPTVTGTLGAHPAAVAARASVPSSTVSTSNPPNPTGRPVIATATIPQPLVRANTITPAEIDPEAVWVHSLPALSARRPG